MKLYAIKNGVKYFIYLRIKLKNRVQTTDKNKKNHLLLGEKLNYVLIFVTISGLGLRKFHIKKTIHM